MESRKQLLSKIQELNDQIDDHVTADRPKHEARQTALLQMLEWYLQKLANTPNDQTIADSPVDRG